MMIIERPNILQFKKKHFLNTYASSQKVEEELLKVKSLQQEIEQMRVNAEIERI